MDMIIFTIADWPITLWMLALAAFGTIVLLILAILLVLLRGNSKRVEETASIATDALRTNFVQQVADRDSRIRQLESELSEARRAHTDLTANSAGLKVQLAEQARQGEEKLEHVQTVRKQMTDEFKALAGDVLKTQSETFTKQNREQVDLLLKPLNDKIGEFHTGLLKDRAAMGESIRALVESNQVITTEANNLTRALKGSSQKQGAWGEMILSTILEQSGLREDEQYFTQQSHTADDGGRVRTDVEILMPNDDRMVIDSKVSLTSYEAYTNSEDEFERDQHLRAHIASVRTHIKTLGGKDYQRHASSGFDYVMMFMPIEPALAAAISADADLFEYGMRQGVVLTTPTTLMTVLRTVRNLWDIEKRHQNAEEIAKRAGALFDKVSGFLGNMDKLDKSIGAAQKNFDDAKGQLLDGRGSVVRQVEMLQELGAKTSKQIPVGWDGGEEDRPAPKLVASQDPESQG